MSRGKQTHRVEVWINMDQPAEPRAPRTTSAGSVWDDGFGYLTLYLDALPVNGKLYLIPTDGKTEAK